MNKLKVVLFLLMSLVVFCPLAKSQEGVAMVTLPTDYTSISDAIKAVSINGTINFINGTYYEYPRVYKSLSMVSLNSSRFGVIIDGKLKNYPDSQHQIYVNANNVVISGFTFLTSYGAGGCGICVENCKNIVIANCTFEDTCSWGIELIRVSNAIISNNNISAKEMSIAMWYCTNITVTYNTLRDADESFHMYNSRGIVFHHNNVFFDEECPHPTYPRISNTTCTWDDGHYGNYWSDYRERYPNATEIGHSGIWNMPYQIDPDDVDGREHFDYYALMIDPQSPQLPPIPEENPHGGCPRSRNCVV
jgi:hypothetical protein